MKDMDGEIARRAYRRYQERGGGEGRELDDWLAAKGEVQAEIEQAEAESEQASTSSKAKQNLR